MRIFFWIRRFVLVAVATFILLFGVYSLRGRDLHTAWSEAAFWAGITAAVFIAARIYQLRQGRQCAICNDGPSTQSPA